MKAIYKRELRSYFTSPIGYVFVAVYLVLSGVLFAYTTLLSAISGGSADIGTYFTVLICGFSFLLPLMYISMGHMFSWPLPAGLEGMENAVSFAMTQLLLTLPIVYVNRKYYQVGYKTLFHGADCHRLYGGAGVRRVCHFSDELWPGAWADGRGAPLHDGFVF